MSMSALEKRVRMLETIVSRLWHNKRHGSRSVEQVNYDTASSLGRLEELTREARLIKEQAEAAGDYRTALGCIRELHHLVELVARLRGELDVKSQPNVLNVHLDSDTAKRIAETYLARRRAFELEAK